MNIIVCIKQVPTREWQPRLNDAKTWIREADASYDGLSVLVTTTSRNQSADSLFSQFKQQNEVELAHHQWKTPLRVHPVFLKNPRRVEALVHLLLIALTAYYLIQRAYRLHVEPDAS